MAYGQRFDWNRNKVELWGEMKDGYRLIQGWAEQTGDKWKAYKYDHAHRKILVGESDNTKLEDAGKVETWLERTITHPFYRH